MRGRHVKNRLPTVNPRAVALAKARPYSASMGKRSRGAGPVDQGPFMPSEDWYEADELEYDGFRVVEKPAGPGHRHAVTPDEVRDRLHQLPEWMLEPLKVVQLSRMTRKKETFPCYGMQWGCALYLYPIEDTFVEYFYTPPKPSVVIESRQYGGRWSEEEGPGVWRLAWTKATLRDFYLNNILIHELGHLLDDRNSSYTDRERYAEWFALEYGYKPTRHQRKPRRIKRRHHAR